MYLYVKLNWDANRFLTGREQGLYEFRFVWVQKYVGYQRGTVCTHGNADYLLENLSDEYHENVVNYKLEHLDDVFFSVVLLAFWIRVFLHKIGSFATKRNIFISDFNFCEGRSSL